MAARRQKSMNFGEDLDKKKYLLDMNIISGAYLTGVIDPGRIFKHICKLAGNIFTPIGDEHMKNV